MPLKGIPSVISPDLLRALALMGHGDEIVLADCHFPATSISSTLGLGSNLIRADGIGVPQLLDAILQLIELDTYVDYPVSVMDLVEGDQGKVDVPIWETYEEIITSRSKPGVRWAKLERMEFYARSQKAFIIVQTGETAQYGNILLTNGIVQKSSQGAANNITKLMKAKLQIKNGKVPAVPDLSALPEIDEVKEDEGAEPVTTGNPKERTKRHVRVTKK